MSAITPPRYSKQIWNLSTIWLIRPIISPVNLTLENTEKTNFYVNNFIALLNMYGPASPFTAGLIILLSLCGTLQAIKYLNSELRYL
jgi:hypothetical protein